MEYQECVELRDNKLSERLECYNDIKSLEGEKAIYEKELDAINNRILEKEALLGFKENFKNIMKQVRKQFLKSFTFNEIIVILANLFLLATGVPAMSVLLFTFITGAITAGISFNDYIKKSEEKIDFLSKINPTDIEEIIRELEVEYDEVKESYDMTVDDIIIYSNDLKSIDLEIEEYNKKLGIATKEETISTDLTLNRKK